MSIPYELMSHIETLRAHGQTSGTITHIPVTLEDFNFLVSQGYSVTLEGNILTVSWNR